MGKNLTSRPISEDLEMMLNTTFPVLDHGFIRVIDYMGCDSAIVQAARVSYGKGTKTINEDAGLINYLMRHSHTTPFEMCEIKFHIKLPIFIARQWIRHRTASVNEYSARYSILDKEFYIPSPENLATQSVDNKQGRGKTLSAENVSNVLNLLKEDAEMCYKHYEEMLNINDNTNQASQQDGLSRELARMNLTLNYYTQWYWKINLHNLLHFVRLRADSHAQFEIREYARKILEIIKLWVPITYNAFINYKVGSVTLSKNALIIVKKMINGEKVNFEESNLSKREWKELMNILQFQN